MPFTHNLKSLLDEGAVWFGDAANLLFHPTHGRSSSSPTIASFSLPQIDSTLLHGGLRFGALHEWFATSTIDSREKNIWYPPLQLLSFLIANTLRANPPKEKQLIIWIGKRCWPTPSLLERTIPNWEESCVFIDPKAQSKKRSFDEILTYILLSGAVLATVFDGKGLSLPLARRLQLAAREGKTLVFAARPPWESSRTTVADTRWRVSPLPSHSAPRLQLELLRARGLVAPKIWELEWSEDNERENLALRLSSTISGDAPETERAGESSERVRA